MGLRNVITIADLKSFLAVKLGKKYKFQIDDRFPCIIDIIFYPIKWFNFIKKIKIKKVLKELKEKHLPISIWIKYYFCPF